jgi:hypothetical protein
MLVVVATIRALWTKSGGTSIPIGKSALRGLVLPSAGTPISLSTLSGPLSPWPHHIDRPRRAHTGSSRECFCLAIQAHRKVLSDHVPVYKLNHEVHLEVDLPRGAVPLLCCQVACLYVAPRHVDLPRPRVQRVCREPLGSRGKTQNEPMRRVWYCKNCALH